MIELSKMITLSVLLAVGNPGDAAGDPIDAAGSKDQPFTPSVRTINSIGTVRPMVDSVNVDEIVVTGTCNETDLRHLPMTITTVGHNQLSRRFDQSILPALMEYVPGMFITSRTTMGYGITSQAAGGMSMRGIGGSPTTRMLVLIDGQPQYMGMMGHPLADSYQTLMAEKVEVLRGPSSVLYGSNAMGGVVNIVTEKRKTENAVTTRLRTYAGSYGTFSAEAANSVHSGKFSSDVAASYNRTDGHRPNSDFNQYTGYAKLGYAMNNRWKLVGDADFSHYNTANPGTIDEPLIDNDASISRLMTSMSLANNYGNTSGMLRLFYNYGYHDINDGYKQGASPRAYHYRSNDRMMGFSLFQSASLLEGNRITAGIDFQHFGGKAWNQYIRKDSTATLADKTENEVAAYVDFRQQLCHLVTVDFGIRYDHHTQTGSEWIPQGGISFALPKDASLKLSVGKGFRNPTIREMYMFRSSNPDLKPERLINYELAYSGFLLHHQLGYGVNVFYLKGDNLIQTVMTNGQPKNINTGEVENWGIEGTVSYSPSAHLAFNANYSFLHMAHPVVSAPTHKLYVGADYTSGRWTASTGVQYVAELYTVLATDNTSATKENYMLWNMRGSYRLCAQVSLFVRGENLLAQHYETYAGFPMPRATVFGGIDIKI